MFNISMKKSGLAAAFALTALLGWAGSVQAIQVIGRWDPTYGAPFTNLGWNGEATFEVPEACLATVGTSSFLNSGSCASQIDIVGATVNFYDTSDGSPEGSMEWGPQAPRFGVIPDVYFATFDGVTLTGITTRIFDFIDGPTSFANNNQYDFALAFVGSGAYLLNRSQVCLGDHCRYVYGINDFNSPDGRAAVTFAIPEPQTYALMLAGLGAMAFVVRRRRHG